jgi:hypothetical protein
MFEEWVHRKFSRRHKINFYVGLMFFTYSERPTTLRDFLCARVMEKNFGHLYDPST